MSLPQLCYVAKASKKEKAKPKKKSRGEYEERLAFNGTFLDIMKASVKHANSKSMNKNNEEYYFHFFYGWFIKPAYQ
jgi:hypothetical protein